MKEFAWAIAAPDGHVELTTRVDDEATAWLWLQDSIVLADRTVESLQAEGYRALRVRIFEVGPE